MDPSVDQLTAELVRLYATSPQHEQGKLHQQQLQQQDALLSLPARLRQEQQLQQLAALQRQTSADSGGGGRCEDALDELVRELHSENLHLRRRLRSAEVEHGHRVRCLVDTLDRMQKEVAEISSRKVAAVKRPKSDCTDQATSQPAPPGNCCHGCDGDGARFQRFRRRSLSIGEDARELASALSNACQELRAENACLMQQLRQLRYRAPALRSSQRRRDLRRAQAEEELAEVREELHRLRVAVLEASVRYPGVEALLLKP